MKADSRPQRAQAVCTNLLVCLAVAVRMEIFFLLLQLAASVSQLFTESLKARPVHAQGQIK
jgi:hypothetical protein